MKSFCQNPVELSLHLVWATHERRPLITPELESPLYHCLEAEALRLGCHIEAIGGMPDHVHLVLTLAPTTSLSQLVQRLKSASSALVLSWAEGYAAFSLSPAQRESAIAYVHYQKDHHRHNTPWPRWERTPDP